jgi:hypothetical protein
MQVDDLRLLGIPRLRSIITMNYPQHDAFCFRLPIPLGKGQRPISGKHPPPHSLNTPERAKREQKEGARNRAKNSMTASV